MAAMVRGPRAGGAIWHIHQMSPAPTTPVSGAEPHATASRGGGWSARRRARPLTRRMVTWDVASRAEGSGARALRADRQRQVQGHRRKPPPRPPAIVAVWGASRITARVSSRCPAAHPNGTTPLRGPFLDRAASAAPSGGAVGMPEGPFT